MQVYRYMDIGTAKITEEEKEGIIHHMIDVKDPDERFSVAEYVKKVKNIEDLKKLCKKETRKVKNIEEDILKRGKNIIIIGGTRIICK